MGGRLPGEVQDQHLCSSHVSLLCAGNAAALGARTEAKTQMQVTSTHLYSVHLLKVLFSFKAAGFLCDISPEEAEFGSAEEEPLQVAQTHCTACSQGRD